ATGETVDGHGLPRDLPRVAPRQGEDHRAEPDPGGADRDGTEQCPRVVGVHVTDADAVPREEPVPAGLLGGRGHVEDLVEGPEGRDDAVPHAATVRARPWSDREVRRTMGAWDASSRCPRGARSSPTRAAGTGGCVCRGTTRTVSSCCRCGAATCARALSGSPPRTSPPS